MTPTDLGIEGYTDLVEVNRGGFATIYRAWQETFERPVAIKVLAGKVDDAALRRFRRECAAIGALSGHPNIVTVYDAGTTADGRPYIVMEFLEGGSLADRIAEEGPLSPAEVLDVGVRIAGAVESVHRAEIVHGDIKPENILLSRLGEPKVADFGLAHLPDGSASSSGGLTGTIVHAAPEVLNGGQPTRASDIYSLASTLYCLLAGRPPFASKGEATLASILGSASGDPPPDLRPRGVPDELCRVLEQGLAKVPGERQHDVGQLGRQLQASQAALGQQITRLPIESAETPAPVPAPARGAPTPRPGGRRRRRIALSTGLVVVIVAALAVAVARSRNPAAALPVLYQDNFDGGQNWYEHDDAGAKLAYDSGAYRIVVKRPHEAVFSDTSFRGGTYGEPLTALTDVSVRARVQAVTPGAIFGLFCRAAPNGDRYQAVLRSDGQALLLKTTATEIKTLATGRVAGIETGRYVSMRLDCTGTRNTRLALVADGNQVLQGTDRGAIRRGSVGMLASAEEPPADVLFEDFVLYGHRGRQPGA